MRWSWQEFQAEVDALAAGFIALGLRVGCHLGQGALPHCGARRGGLIAFRYDSHSTARRSHTGERGIGFCHNA